MSRSIQPARVGAAAALAAAVLLAAACSAGQTAQTSTQKSTVDGVSGNVGGLALRDVRVAYPEGGRYATGASAPLEFVVVNDASRDDRLVSARTDVAPMVALSPGPTASEAATSGGSTGGTTASATPSTSPTTSETASPTGSATASVTPSATPTSTQTAAEGMPVPIPAGELVRFAEGGATAELTGLTRDLIPGQIVMITFTFAQAGSVTLPVPVATPLQEVERPTPTASSTG